MEPIFKTKRLLVRELTTDDLAPFHEMQGNVNVMRYVGTPPMNLEENRKDLEKVLSAYPTPENEFNVWAVTTKPGGFVGTVALLKNDKAEWEIGYRLLESKWGNGYGSEITAGLINYAFRIHKVDILVAYVDKRNEASVHILSKYMRFVKEFWNEVDQCTDLKFEINHRK
ncbi:GNAT family N-acetyltransferase; N-acetyltransferase [Flavobacteriaceae bacterium M23B6Z8]